MIKGIKIERKKLKAGGYINEVLWKDSEEGSLWVFSALSVTDKEFDLIKKICREGGEKSDGIISPIMSVTKERMYSAKDMEEAFEAGIYYDMNPDYYDDFKTFLDEYLKSNSA